MVLSMGSNGFNAAEDHAIIGPRYVMSREWFVCVCVLLLQAGVPGQGRVNGLC